MLVKTYNQKGEKLDQTKLAAEIFGVKINPDLVHQVVVAQMANRRKTTAHTKGRGEVRGGGKKPWRQKGTGRARHGSIRSPIWRGGGVTFGPTKERVFKKTINRKMRRKALLMVLSGKAKNELLVLLDGIKIAKSKTKLMSDILKNLPCGKNNSLLVLPAIDKDVIRAAKNLPSLQTIQARDLNCLDLLQSKYLIMPKEALRVIKETFAK